MFAHTIAAIAAASITIAPPVSVLRKLRTGAARLRAHAVRPPKEMTCELALICNRLCEQSPGMGRA